MNKISKKIVALATMAAFVLTLVPAAAFAAPADPSSYTVAAVSADKYNQATVSIDISDSDAAGSYQNVLVWAEENGTVCDSNDVTYKGTAVDSNFSTGWTSTAGDYFYVGQVTDQTVTVDFSKLGAGNYKIYVYLNDGSTEDLKTIRTNSLNAEGILFAIPGLASPYASKLAVGSDYTAFDADQYDTKTVEFDLRDSYNKPLDDEILQNVVIWATDEDGNFTDAIDFTATTNTLTAVGDNFYSVANNVDSDSTFKATFKRGGVYYIYAGVGTVEDPNAGTVADSLADGFVKFNAGNGLKVTVTPATQTVDYITLTGKDVTGDYTLKLDNEKEIYDINLVGYKGWDANGTAEYTLTGVAHQKDGSVAENQEITLTSGADKNLLFGGKDASVTVKTDRNGEFKTTFTMNDKRNVPITITVGDKKFTVRIVTETSRAYDIDATVDGGYVLAGTDSLQNMLSMSMSLAELISPLSMLPISV